MAVPHSTRRAQHSLDVAGVNALLAAAGLASGPQPPTLREVWEAFDGRFVRQVEAGERSGRSLADYRLAARDLLQVLEPEARLDALRPADFGRLRAHMASRLGKKTLKNRINNIRTILRSAGELRDADGRRRFNGEPDYGREFERPSLPVLRRERQRKQSRAWEPEEIRRLLAAAREPLRTMILLGINGGLGNTDIAQLAWGAVDLAKGWLDYPRPKTAVERRVPLWPDTAAALRAHRRASDGGAGELVFLTERGRPWVRTQEDGRHVDALTSEFQKLRRRTGLQKPVGFYGLRHSFQTLGEEAGDLPAVAAIMGHVDPTMAAVYRERIRDGRLRAVVAVVHREIFG